MNEYNWNDIIATLSAGGALIEVANTPPAASEYLSGRFLPRQLMPDYEVSGGQMEINTVMAGHVGMDSKYPEGTSIRLNDYGHKTAKYAQAIPLEEEPARQLGKLLLLAEANRASGRTVADFMTEAGYNLYEKGVVQALDDTAEYVAMSALTQGKIDWTFNGRRLLVDYKIPERNRIKLTGEQRLSGSQSGFWKALGDAEDIVRGSVGVVMSQNTLRQVLANQANEIEVISDTYSPQRNIRTVQVRRLPRYAISGGTNQLVSTGDRVTSATLIGYGRQGQIIDPTNVGQTIGVQMVKDNVIAVIGANTANQLVSLTGTPVPEQALGYVHVAPTVEGTFRGVSLGRWGRIWTPENDPYQLRAEGVENSLPVIRNASRLVLIESEAAE
ncbi:hypothetical protein [Deinococcus sp. Marseille-Q6407]|uniref:hypothetical protein n=1 Tax=Deinococcus sp. Marseille-Q6407 TaxID=2969223 RepID=UPI0021C14456|nr:hypothetical protein [Deinococcus sp. Marseille-Q6407]